MSAITEIYISKFGERLEDGALQTTDEIQNRNQAERDALQMCQRDPTIDKIAYYAVREDGINRHLLTYTNPSNPHRNNVANEDPDDDRPSGIRLKQPKAPSLWRRILSWFG